MRRTELNLMKFMSVCMSVCVCVICMRVEIAENLRKHAEIIGRHGKTIACRTDRLIELMDRNDGPID